MTEVPPDSEQFGSSAASGVVAGCELTAVAAGAVAGCELPAVAAGVSSFAYQYVAVIRVALGRARLRMSGMATTRRRRVHTQNFCPIS